MKFRPLPWAHANEGFIAPGRQMRGVMEDDDDCWPEFPVILGQGSLHDLRDADQPQQSRLWGLKSTSRAACEAMDRKREPKARKEIGRAHV